MVPVTPVFRIRAGAARFGSGNRIGIERARRMAGMRAFAQRSDQVVHRQLHHRAARGQAGAADMRGEHQVTQRQQLRPHARLAFVDIQAGTGQTPVGQRIGQRQLIDDPAARDVHQRGGGAHLAQRRPIDDVVRVPGVRHHQYQMIGLRKQGIELNVLCAQRLLGGGRQLAAVVIQHAHAEAVRAAPCDALPDPAHA